MITRRLSLLGLTILLCAMVVPAQVQPTSRVIAFSGSIPGQPDGPVALRFRLFPAETGGDRCFEETQAMVSVTTEAFSVFIGDGTTGGIPLSCFTDNQTLWVAFAMDARPDAEIGDRTPITSSGFAHFAPAAGDAATLGGLSAAAFARLAIANTFSAGQTINGNVSASQYSIGANRVLSTQGGNNLFVGGGAGQALTTGTGNMASGSFALRSNTSGNNNTASGSSALGNNTDGAGNTAVGAAALSNNTGGSNNTAIGWAAGVARGSGNLTNATAIGAGAIVSASNSLVLGNNANVGIGTSAPAAKLQATGGPAGNGTGLITVFTDLGHRITGNGTRFTTELHVGDAISAGGQTRIVESIMSDRVLIVSRAFSSALRDVPFTFQQPVTRMQDSSGTTRFMVTSSGNVQVIDSSNAGLRVQTDALGGTVASFGGNGEFRVDAPGWPGGRLTILENGNVGIGTPPFNPRGKLDVIGNVFVGGTLFVNYSNEVSAPVLIDSGAFGGAGTATVFCPVGSRATGGGWNTSPSKGAPEFSRPTPGGTGWTVRVFVGGLQGMTTLTAEAICMRVG